MMIFHHNCGIVRFANGGVLVMEISYRKATKADMEIMTDLLFLLYHDEGQAPELSREELFEENEVIFADINQIFFLAFDGEKPVGVSHGALRREYVNGTNDGFKGYLEAIYVLPEYRKNKIAAKLVNILECWASQLGCREMASDCLLDNTGSYNFHLSIGYEETERNIFFLKELKPQDYKYRQDNIVLKEVLGAEEKSAICNSVLRALPSWFGIEESIVDYVEQVKMLPFIAAYDGGNPVGFVAIMNHTPYASEICVMGVLKEYHREGIGRSLVIACEKYCREKKQEYLTVKTLDESRESKSYEKTRLFYLSMGFKPLEVFPTLWDEDNPCLLLIKRV